MAANFFQLLSAIFTRIIFLVHGFVSVLLVVQSLKNTDYWWLCTGLVLLVVESFYTIIIRKGQEYKYFWPGSLLYMCTVLPVIWVAEMNILELKKSLSSANITQCELQATQEVTRITSIGPITLRNDNGTGAQKWSKLGLILVIIIGRWLLPRGELTRDQLSALLLVYVANAADIMELFELFDDHPELWCEAGIAQAILATYTWCFMQFTLVFTATAKTVPDEARKKMNEAVKTINDQNQRKNKRTGREKRLPKYIKKLIYQKQQHDLETFEKNLNKVFGSPIEANKHKDRGRRKHKLKYSMHETVQGVVEVQRERKIEEEVIEEVIKEKEKLRFHGDLYSILTIMLMQDGPFFVVRLIMVISYNVTNETHIFFMGKNVMALAVLFYRLLVLLYEGKNEEIDEESDDEFVRRPFVVNYDRESTYSEYSTKKTARFDRESTYSEQSTSKKVRLNTSVV